MIVNILLELTYDLQLRHACAYKYPTHSTTYLRPRLQTRPESNIPLPHRKHRYV